MFSTNLAVMPVAAGLPPAVQADAVLTPTQLQVYDLDEELAALVETLDAVPAEQEPELLTCIATALNTVEGRDRLGRLMAHLEAQQPFFAAEIQRLEQRKAMHARVNEKLEGLTISALKALGKTAKKKWHKLAGQFFTFSLSGKAAGVLIDDPQVVPVENRKTTLAMPAALWEEILDALPIELSGKAMDQAKRKDEPSKSSIKAAIDAGKLVPGARLEDEAVRLVRG